ncbi:MAG TPA: hypothetical protein VGI39_32680 [Polyangiaceae bacterium]
MGALALGAAGCGSAESSESERPLEGETASTSQDLLSIPIQICLPPTYRVCSPNPKTGQNSCFCENDGTMTFTPVREYGVQPGWARATFNYAASGATTYSFGGSVTCASGSPSSVNVSTTVLSSSLVAVDVRANLPWLAANGLPKPCQVSAVNVTATNKTVIGSGTLANTFAMDVPVSHLTPSQVGTISGSSVSLEPIASSRRYFAYPPMIVAIRSANGHTAIAEVEELTARGTVGLRALSDFDYWGNLDREYGGGAEIYAGWGIDIELLGVTKTTSGTEESNPGHNAYTTGALTVPPLYVGDPGGAIYPAPPTYSEATYLADVLDNRAVPRCNDPRGCLDVTYDATAHTLNAVNGAQISWIEGGPIEAGVTLPIFLIPPHLLTGAERASQTPLEKVSTAESIVAPILSAPIAIAPPTVTPAPVAGSSALVAATKYVPPATPSPQMLAVPRNILGGFPIVTSNSCPLSGSTSSVPLTKCNGMSSSFPCPTAADPLRIDALPGPNPSSPGLQASLAGMMPQYAGRSNYMGTCGSHAGTQYYELLVNRLGQDIGTPRALTVDGQSIVVPNPLIAYSVGGGLTDLYNWGGIKAGDPDVDPAAAWPTNNHALPQYLNAYWPAYEGDWSSWTTMTVSDPRAKAALARCSEKGYWFSGYCVGEGQPPPGAYWNYNQQLQTKNPFAAMPWSLANSYFDVTASSLPLNDRSLALRQIEGFINAGLPLQMTLQAFSGNVTDSAGGKQSLLGDMTWFMPPELASCDNTTISNAFQPNGGHVINIIGYSVVGTLEAPDDFRSYLVIENNWGKGSGYHGYFAMNFAAFKYLASSLTINKLVCSYSSIACEPILH